jgi:phosphatidylglycerophosphate synthase
MLYHGEPAVQMAASPLLFVLIMLDSLDGMIARRTNTSSLIGSVLDIAADRVYELVLWVVFAHLGLVSVAIPLIVITRTTVTDALRSVGVREGQPPFRQHRSALGRFIVGSPWMRSIYSVSKIVSFCGLTVVVALSGYPPGSSAVLAGSRLLEVFRVTSWVAVVLCVLRGSPVMVGALRRSRAGRDAEA